MFLNEPVQRPGCDFNGLLPTHANKATLAATAESLAQ